ncbi:MAG: autorepressor SdpR family transcription factor [Erysipelotrichaceae bacterium]
MLNDTFHALNDETRRKIIHLLKGQPMSAGDIAKQFALSPATVSHHLSILKKCDLVSDIREGKYIYYELNLSVIDELLLFFTHLKGDSHES